MASILILIFLVALHGVTIKNGFMPQPEQLTTIALIEIAQDLEAEELGKCCENDSHAVKIKTAHCFADTGLEANTPEPLVARLKDLHSPLPYSHTRFDAYGTLFRPPIV